MKMFRTFLICLTLLGSLFGPTPARCTEPEDGVQSGEELARRLENLERKIGDRQSGLISRHVQTLRRMEEALGSGDYREFGDFIETRIVEPWAYVNRARIMQYQANPPHMTANNRPEIVRFLKSNGTRVARIETNLRRARRLMTRLEKLHADTRRGAVEIERLLRRYDLLIAEYARIAPREAEVHRNHLRAELEPLVVRLHERTRDAADKVDIVTSWMEKPGLKLLLKRLTDVHRALDDLKRHYHL